MPDALETNRWWRPPLAWLAASIGFIALFMHFGSEVLERETGTFDNAIRRWVLGFRSPVMTRVFGVVTQLGAWYTLGVGAIIVATVLARRGALKRPLFVATVPFIVSLVIALLKHWYGVDRPDVTSALTFSFPSGHTSESTAVAIVIGYVLRREGVAARLGLVIAVAVPILVGLSRIVLDMHWASDVIGGWLIGSAYAAGVCALYEVAFRRARQRELAA
jgi:membrane-associated phospholipid phosphatase